MIMTPTKAREVGEALIDAADTVDASGTSHHVIYNEDLQAAICVPSNPTSDAITHTVAPE